MNKINFKNLPNTTTPLNATNLNQLQDNVDNAKLEKTIFVTTANTNLDDYVTENRYYFSAEYTPVNIPAGVNGILEVFLGNGVIKQFWYRHGTANTTANETYVRTRTSGGLWSEWDRFVVKKELDEIGTWESISDSLVFNTEHVTVMENRCYVNKIAKLCYIHLRVKAVDATNGLIVSSGAPKALSSLGLNGQDITNNSSSIQVWARSSGDIIEATNLTTGNEYYINGCYPYSSL